MLIPRPVQIFNLGAIHFPKLNLCIMNSRHDAHAFGFGFESWMPQEAPDEPGGIIRPHIERNQTIGRMDKTSFEEVPILCEKRNSPMPMH